MVTKDRLKFSESIEQGKFSILNYCESNLSLAVQEIILSLMVNHQLVPTPVQPISVYLS